MIVLTQLNGSDIFLNSSLIETLERTPDTVITLTTGKKVIVRESPEEVIDKVVEFAAKVSGTSFLTKEGVA